VGSGEVDVLLTGLKRLGGRSTTARRAVAEVLCGTEEHLTADDVLAAVQHSHPDVHASTVYRILAALEEADLVEHAHLGHGPAVYHLVGRTHLHLVCEVCGSVTEAPSTVARSLAREAEQTYGFLIEPRHFALVGRCRQCAATT